jgi:Protein of unknown function (DUF2934)
MLSFSEVLGGNPMDSKETFKANVLNQLSQWRATINRLKIKVEHAEVDAKAKLHDQLELLSDKRAKAEKILEDISVTSQDAWEQIKSGVDQGWNELSRTARNTMAKVRKAIATPRRDEEISQVAYKLWQDEGCPDGRNMEHWSKAESIWQARQVAAQTDHQPRAIVKRVRKKKAAPAKAKSRMIKRKVNTSKEHPGRRAKVL